MSRLRITEIVTNPVEAPVARGTNDQKIDYMVFLPLFVKLMHPIPICKMHGHSADVMYEKNAHKPARQDDLIDFAFCASRSLLHNFQSFLHGHSSCLRLHLTHSSERRESRLRKDNRCWVQENRSEVGIYRGSSVHDTYMRNIHIKSSGSQAVHVKSALMKLNQWNLLIWSEWQMWFRPFNGQILEFKRYKPSLSLIFKWYRISFFSSFILSPPGLLLKPFT